MISLVVEYEYHLRDEMNELDKIKMFMSKQFVSYFAKVISEMIEVIHDKLFVKT